MATLMKCGHVANASSNGKPVCVICVGMNPDAMIVDHECQGTEGLEGRIARCGQCGASGATPSKWELPFFEYRPNREFDSYYCGCFGWD